MKFIEFPVAKHLADTIQVIQSTTGCSSDIADYAECNLGLHVNDFAKNVHHNRMAVVQKLQAQGVNSIHWLNQVHSNKVTDVTVNHLSAVAPLADASITRHKGQALAVMTADCLPIILSNEDGSEVAAVHAGWRGLANGIVENTIQAMHTQPAYAWIGAAIGKQAFEVGQSVYEEFCLVDEQNKQCFTTITTDVNSEQKYLADLSALAANILAKQGIDVHVSGLCSYGNSDFYSYRQATHQQKGQSVTVGRMAMFVWIR